MNFGLSVLASASGRKKRNCCRPSSAWPTPQVELVDQVLQELLPATFV
jgi:hypothetical protein